jgi:hypothetical protein
MGRVLIVRHPDRPPPVHRGPKGRAVDDIAVPVFKTTG